MQRKTPTRRHGSSAAGVGVRHAVVVAQTDAGGGQAQRGACPKAPLLGVQDFDPESATLTRRPRRLRTPGLHALGFRGVRFNLLFLGGTGLDQLEIVARKIAPLGWHVQLLLDGQKLAALAPRLRRLPTPYVIDHMGHFPAAEGPASAPMEQLLTLLASDRCWVKLSGPYRLVAEETPYAGTSEIARRLVEHAPHRLVWGSDWPHPSIRQSIPDDGRLFELLGDWAPDGEIRRRILVDNPRLLYDA